MWWLSYANDEGFLGAVVVRASHFLEACQASGIMGLSPGGQVKGLEIPAEFRSKVADRWIERLLTEEECKEFDQEMENILSSN